MACILSTTGLNRGVKGVLTQFFVNFADCTQGALNAGVLSAVTGTYDELCCMRSLTPPGAERALTQDEGCIGEDVEYQDLGPVTFSQVSVTFRDQLSGLSDWNRCANGDQVPDGLADAFYANTIVACCIKHPLADPVNPFLYELFDAQIVSITPGEITKNEYRETTVVFQPTSKSYCGLASLFTDVDVSLETPSQCALEFALT